jgi:hypothetical protein
MSMNRIIVTLTPSTTIGEAPSLEIAYACATVDWTSEDSCTRLRPIFAPFGPSHLTCDGSTNLLVRVRRLPDDS